ncbi:diguanylate cyclase [Actinoplanes sp. URMC 104]|uniref:diguanylate cyclase n=1 Tax=Actinoplanes sp. URMC 104 TaxID=3423409 RepID=UPI003F1D3719
MRRTAGGLGTRLALPAAVTVVTAALAGWCLATSAGLRLQVVACWLAVAVFASLMSYHAYRAGRQMAPDDPRRRFWIALAVASGIFAAGEWAQVATAAGAPFDVASLTGTGTLRTAALALGCAVIVVVVLTYPIPHRSARERLCYLLDLATVVTAAGVYGLYCTVSTSVVAHDLVVVATGPVVAMLTAFAVCRLFLSGAAPFRWHIGVVGPFAAAVEALARALGPELVRDGRSTLIFTLTLCSHAMLTIVTWAQHRSADSAPRKRDAAGKRPFSLLPYAALVATFALLVITLAVHGLDLRAWVAVAGVAAITGIVVVRQLTAFVDNANLLRQRDMLAARLHSMAFTDSLTGLGNRAFFLDHLGDALRAGDGGTGVLLIDLDDFKPVNDSYGHAAGDAVLVETAARLRACVRPEDVVARLGGDEFAVLLDGLPRERITVVADRIVEAVGASCRLTGGEQVRVQASVGVAVAGGDERDASALLKKADDAMYAAKGSGKGSFRVAAAAE